MADLYDSGLVTICALSNTASDGNMPVYALTGLYTQSFEEKTVSLTRSYLARGVDQRVDMVIRIESEGFRPKVGQYALLTFYEGQENEAGDQYRIDLVQATTNEDELRVYDLTLYRLEENYAVTIG